MANKDSSSPTRNGAFVIDSNSDLHPERKQTLRDYLKGITTGKPNDGVAELSDNLDASRNFYGIGEADSEISAGPNDDGTPAALTDLADTQPHFTFSIENEAKQIFNDVSSGAFFDVDANTSGNQIQSIAEAASTEEADFKNSQAFGHRLQTPEVVQTVAEQVSTVLLNNRFSPPAFDANGDNDTFVRGSNNESLVEFDTRNAEKEQIYFGSNNNEEAMAKLGAEAVIAASGFMGTEPAENQGTSTLQGIWDGLFAEFGLALNVDNVEPGSGFGLDSGISDVRLRDGTQRIPEPVYNPTRDWINRDADSQPNIDIDFIDSEGRPSSPNGSEENHAFTVMNSMISTFIQNDLFGNRQYVNGLNFMAAIFVENILLATIFDALLLAELLATPQQQTNLRSQYDNDPVQLSMGKARGNVVPFSDFPGNDGNELAADILELLGIPDVQQLFSGPFLVEFVMNFMGINKPIQTKTNLTVKSFKVGDFISFVPSFLIGSLQTTISAVKDPYSSGFFFNLGRQIARKSALAEAPEPFGDSLAFINYLFELRQTANFRFFITMVNLGDNAIGQFAAKLRNRRGPDILNETRVQLGGLVTNPAAIVASPSLFFIPKSFQNFRQQIGKTSLKSGIPVFETVDDLKDNDPMHDQFYTEGSSDSSITGRIPDEVADSLEQHLENDYMPFYIKDMRTNEIISFHAFLDTLSDGFTANYTATTGLGRIEAAQTYESSSRTIGVSFTMVAFSETDMDMLYWKLNKLVTLCYPQFSKGTKLEGKDKSFYMPFSQIQTASPMIRLRIGDVLTNNFSQASSARLLGVGDAETTGLLDEFTARVKAIPSENAGFSAFCKGLTPTQKQLLGPTILSIQTNQEFVQVGDVVTITANGSSSVDYGKVIVGSTPIIGATVKKGIGRAAPKTPVIYGINHLSSRGSFMDTFKIIGFETPDPEKPNIEKTYVWLVSSNITDLVPNNAPDRTKFKEFLKKTGDRPDGFCFRVKASFITGVVTSLSAENKKFILNNTTTKAFQNNKGSGIAGFIDNLQIDWMLNTLQWGSGIGKRAPTGCKLTIGFRPIHDITPGIDADGFNRAPVYKVGKYSRDVHAGGVLDIPLTDAEESE